MAFDADKFAKNIENIHSLLQHGGKFRITGPEFRGTITHSETMNVYLLTIQSTAVIIFDNWELSTERDALRFTRRYVGYDGDIFFMTTGSVSLIHPEKWVVGELEASE